MLVSVVIPAYNCAGDLRIALASILAQSVSDWECIVVDDGSSPALADTLAFADPRIRFVRHPRNLGRGAARNTGLAQARGEFVAWQDADDWSYPERLERQCSYLEAHPELIAVSTAAAVVDSSEQLLGIRSDRSFGPRLLAELEAPRIVHPTLMLRRRLLQGISYPSWLRVSEDLVFMTQAFRAAPFANLGEPLYCYREEQSQSVAKYWGSTRTRLWTHWQSASRMPARTALQMALATGKLALYTAAAGCGARGLLYRRRQRSAERAEGVRHQDAWGVVRLRAGEMR
jgi:glycosyltransferase involved in cell wall biosynthesis